MSNLTNIIARNVRRLRIERDLTIAAFSTKSSIAEDIIIEIEAGNYRPDPEEFLRLSESLGVKPADLLSGN